jgi:hypothetical protein
LYRVEAIELLLQFEGGSPVVELPPRCFILKNLLFECVVG